MVLPESKRIFLTVDDLTELGLSHILILEKATILVAPTRSTCGFDNCLWHGIDFTEVSNHVDAVHNDVLCLLLDVDMQFVITFTEMQTLAVQGSLTIDKLNFLIVEPVKYMWLPQGGAWHSASEHFIESTNGFPSPLKTTWPKESLHYNETAREVELKAQIAELRNDNDVMLAGKDEQFRELMIEFEKKEKVNNALRVDRKQQQTNKSEELTKVVRLTQSDLDSVKLKLQNQEKEHQTEIARLKSSVQRTDSALRAAELKAKEEKDCHDKYVIDNTGILEGGLKLNHRFFIYAKEGQIDRSTEPYRRSEEDKKTLEAGNDSAHRANFKTHQAMFRAGHLSQSEIDTFKQMYGISPDAKIVMTEKFYDALDEMGTVAAFLSCIKFPGTRANDSHFLYQEFKRLRDQVITATVPHSSDEHSFTSNQILYRTKSEFDNVIDKCLPRMKQLSAQMKERDKKERNRDN